MSSLVFVVRRFPFDGPADRQQTQDNSQDDEGIAQQPAPGLGGGTVRLSDGVGKSQRPQTEGQS